MSNHSYFALNFIEHSASQFRGELMFNSAFNSVHLPRTQSFANFLLIFKRLMVIFKIEPVIQNRLLVHPQHSLSELFIRVERMPF